MPTADKIPTTLLRRAVLPPWLERECSRHHAAWALRQDATWRYIIGPRATHQDISPVQAAKSRRAQIESRYSNRASRSQGVNHIMWQ
eukprot:11118999-Lingulodinium_polyedra.AAC.1